MTDAEVFVRLLLAAFFGGLVGWEREIAGRAAGFRTHILVSMGAALVMLTSIELFRQYGERTEVDPTRMAAQVVSGIGFLGAGTIFRAKASIRGLTTAASLWTVAGVGLAVGSGFYLGAIITTMVVLVVLFALTKLEPRHMKGCQLGTDVNGNGEPGGD